jgi:hypothetical protein
MAWSVVGSFFKSGYRIHCLCGMLRTSANPGLSQPMEQIAYAHEAAVCHSIFACDQPLHIDRTPTAHAVSPDIRRHADTRLERCQLRCA